jgi:hypothetical protein
VAAASGINSMKLVPTGDVGRVNSPPNCLESAIIRPERTVRIRQQEILAELGVLALQRPSFIDMLNHTARMTYCKVLQYIPAEDRLLVRAGGAIIARCLLNDRSHIPQ